MWHPDWSEHSHGSAECFIHFREELMVDIFPAKTLHIQISSDTKYKLYINSKLVSLGPVKGNDRLGFYDEFDIQPYLTLG